MQKLREMKEGAVSAGHAFLIPMFLLVAELDSVMSNNLNNPKNRAQKLEPWRDLLPGLSDVLHHGRVAGLHLTQKFWWHGWQDWRSP